MYKSIKLKKLYRNIAKTRHPDPCFLIHLSKMREILIRHPQSRHEIRILHGESG